LLGLDDDEKDTLRISQGIRGNPTIAGGGKNRKVNLKKSRRECDGDGERKRGVVENISDPAPVFGKYNQ